jgi:hypothetical protein
MTILNLLQSYQIMKLDLFKYSLTTHKNYSTNSTTILSRLNSDGVYKK